MLGHPFSAVTGAAEGLEYWGKILIFKSHEVNVTSFSSPQPFPALTRILQNSELGINQIT